MFDILPSHIDVGISEFPYTPQLSVESSFIVENAHLVGERRLRDVANNYFEKQLHI
jgi:hypothetical protein